MFISEKYEQSCTGLVISLRLQQRRYTKQFNKVINSDHPTIKITDDGFEKRRAKPLDVPPFPTLATDKHQATF
ncbi:hypothetical protein BG000_002604 [Podila horticola]|nr:hypothetical protein BG000_002604 [Podila horticola]